MTVAYDGTFTLSGLGNTEDVRLALTPTTLLACDPDGLYRADAEMTVQGDLSGHGCHAAINFANALAIVVQPDETDPSHVRIGITPALPDIGMTVLACPKNVRPFPVNVAFTDLWGRMMANRPVKIGQASVITAEIAQGAGRGHTTTKITVTRPSDTAH